MVINQITTSNNAVEEERLILAIKQTPGSSKVAEAEELILAIKIGITSSRIVAKDKTRILHHRVIIINRTRMDKEDNSKNTP